MHYSPYFEVVLFHAEIIDLKKEKIALISKAEKFIYSFKWSSGRGLL